MSESFFLALITGAVVPIIIVVVGAYVDLRKKLIDASRNIEKVEIATNSMKDALVDAAMKAGLKQGAEDERLKGDRT